MKPLLLGLLSAVACLADQRAASCANALPLSPARISGHGRAQINTDQYISFKHGVTLARHFIQDLHQQNLDA